eukprot:CAMPEP_0177641156 /NCGR_PEP_ID=MMETSP0447-20121125/6920_1 /TAXON_ID=0 /ORGANISM="Stygamoeba regulata, Strain BSH-02190019" /LENGTH=421 /DNA_ID=CAMNT_0019143263 /DNA_START=8 /DNA_END=1273 /DNA_ORIENTATION=+
MKEIKTVQQSQYAQTCTDSHLINFVVGQPSPSMLEKALHWAQGTLKGKASFGSPTISPFIMQYGAAEGHESFRVALAKYLTGKYQFPVEASQLMTTNGNSHALSLVCRVLAAKALARAHASGTPPQTPVIVCEDPTYFLAKRIFDDMGFDCIGIEMDEEGMIVKDLERRLIVDDLRPLAVYTIPNFHNPTGVCMSPERRQHLLRLAHQHNFHIVCDEPYTLLTFDDSHDLNNRNTFFLEEHKTPEASGRVISMGSFSKLIAPGLRLGWLHASADMIRTIKVDGVFFSGGGANPLVASMVEEGLESGSFEKSLQDTISTLKTQKEALVSALRTALPPYFEFDIPRGGYFLWIEFPSFVDVEKINEEGRSIGVRVCSGGRCSVRPDTFTNCARFSFAFYQPAELKEGVERLACILKAHYPEFR